MMYKGYLTITLLIICIHASVSSCDKSDCDSVCTSAGCNTSQNHLNGQVPEMEYCTKADIPNDINFIVKDESSKLPAELQVHFKFPRRTCKYRMSLLANGTIDEEKCMSYNFKNSEGSEMHTHKTVCFISTDTLMDQNSIYISFQYIFTACYSVEFLSDGQPHYFNKFLKTNYNRTEVTIPSFECSYTNIQNNKMHKTVSAFKVNLSTPIIQQVAFELGSSFYIKKQKFCDWNDEALSHYKWCFDISMTNEKYEKEISFEVEGLQNESYCFRIYLIDIRCEESTLWKPPKSRYSVCSWKTDCRRISEPVYPISVNSPLSTSIAIITLSVFIVLGIMYFVYVIYSFNVQKEMINIHFHKSNVEETEKLKCNNNSKEKCGNVTINTDIVLLYPRSSESFMALMADFRGILSKVCQCHVHDWYDGVEWNYVAEIGGSDWFSEMLRKDFRVIWIDTPKMRSLITRSVTQNIHIKEWDEKDIVEICDFRDTLFPVLLNLAKRNVEKSLIQHKHFVIRLKGFENFGNEDDPFVDLSPRTRYLLPQDLNFLCSTLSTSGSDVIPFMSLEEDILKQRLYRVENDFQK